MKTKLSNILGLLFCALVMFSSCDKDDGSTMTNFEKEIIGSWEYEKTSFISDGQELSLEELLQIYKLLAGTEVEIPDAAIFSKTKLVFTEDHHGDITFEDDMLQFDWKLIGEDQIKITDKSDPENTITLIRVAKNSIYFDVEVDNFDDEEADLELELFESVRTYLVKK